MNRSYRIIPVYTGDVSGVASALFEMGGMVVIHDPSGCNSTYNTHDETRWYDMDSLIFISGLSNTDAIMGDDEKLIREIEEAAEELHPKFIALCSSPIPYMNGTDFPAIARILTADTGIPAFYVPANGMHDYVFGAGAAMLKAAECLLDKTREPRREKGILNLLGVTPLEFAADGSVENLRKWAEDGGYKIQSCWAMEDSLEQLQKAVDASVNVVVSSVGLPLAEYMEKTYGIPWVAGCPVGAFAKDLLKAVKQTEESGVSQVAYLKRGACSCGARIHLVGEPVTMGSLAAAITRETGMITLVVCPVEADERLTGMLDIRTDGEEEAETALKQAMSIIADPLYRPICPEEAEFRELPHQAFSGRCFRRRMQTMDAFLTSLRKQ
ncbi:MAG: oxidoreductase [Lachnospiraceae bacterium]|nr:oxidoreductase [Lachnospiraceae bacterium]